MPGERRKRQQRVRHEVGGGVPVPADTQESHDASSNSTAAVASAAPTAAAKVAAAAPIKATQDGGRGGGGAGKGPHRGGAGKPGRRGFAVATVDESQYYQPVTIMESKPKDGDPKENNDAIDELDEAPRKYKRRAIVSNWSRYEQPPTWDDELDDGSDYLIGEDFSDVLTNQSLGSGGGGHLQLRGEEGWGLDDSVGDRSLLGLGALRVSDLVSTMATVPLTLQLGIQDNRMPEQLADYYTQLADDNRRLYGPLTAAQRDVDIQIIEEQIRKLRLAFFDETSSNKVKKPLRKHDANSSNEEASGNSLGGFVDEEIVGGMSTNIDFSEDLNEDKIESKLESGKVDLTAKMCQAFGSNLKDVTDDNFVDFVAEDSDLASAIDSKAAGEVSGAGTQGIPAPTPGMNEFTSSAEVPTLQQLADANKRSGSQKTSKGGQKQEESPSLDFSGGHQSFNFGLPKVTPAAPAAAPKLGEHLKDEDVFAPPMKPEVPHKSAAPQVDLDAPIMPESSALVTSKEDTKELEDWLDSVLDD